MWQESLNAFLQHYSPCYQQQDITDTFTTEEIAQTIERHTGEKVERKLLYEELHRRNYTFGVINDTELHWLMVKLGTTLVLSNGRTLQ